MPEFLYFDCQTICGRPLESAVKPYIRLSETMKTRCLPTANEFSISSPVFSSWTFFVFGLSVPTLPSFLVTNQMRPLKSGSAEVIRSSPVTALVRS